MTALDVEKNDLSMSDESTGGRERESVVLGGEAKKDVQVEAEQVMDRAENKL